MKAQWNKAQKTKDEDEDEINKSRRQTKVWPLTKVEKCNVGEDDEEGPQEAGTFMGPMNFESS